MNRSELINGILELKPVVIELGFDFPTQSLDEATTAELEEFYEELVLYHIETNKNVLGGF
jgi:hypothetical protein